MSHPVLVEGVNCLEVRSLMHPGMRIALMLLGLFPMIAPYELLVRVDWQNYLHPLFFLAAFISAGGIALSLFFFFAAVAGISSRLVFDRSASTVSHFFEAPIVRRTSRVYPLSAVGSIEVGSTEWSDSAPSYYLRVVIDDGTLIKSGSSSSRDEVVSLQSRIERFIEGEEASQSAV